VSKFIDAAGLEEDKRIDLIGKSIMEGVPKDDKPFTAGVVVEDHIKADRYIDKLKVKFPMIRVIKKFDGPVQNTVTILLGLFWYSSKENVNV